MSIHPQVVERASTFFDLASDGRRVDRVISLISVAVIALAFIERTFELYIAYGKAGTASAVVTLVITAVALAVLPFVWHGSFFAHLLALAALVIPCVTNRISVSEEGEYINFHFGHTFDARNYVALAISWLAVVIIVVALKARRNSRIEAPVT
jgi:hypothetical protein